MTSTRPYLIRAMLEWILDNGMTPHLLIDTKDAAVQAPRQYEQEGRLVLNISPDAIQDLNINSQAVSFNARFDGQAMPVYIPVDFVLAIYTRENGQGMMFGNNSELRPPPDPCDPSSKRSHLKIVK